MELSYTKIKWLALAYQMWHDEPVGSNVSRRAFEELRKCGYFNLPPHQYVAVQFEWLYQFVDDADDVVDAGCP